MSAFDYGLVSQQVIQHETYAMEQSKKGSQQLLIVKKEGRKPTVNISKLSALVQEECEEAWSTKPS